MSTLHRNSCCFTFWFALTSLSSPLYYLYVFFFLGKKRQAYHDLKYVHISVSDLAYGPDASLALAVQEQ